MTKAGIVWYGRKVQSRYRVFSSWILRAGNTPSQFIDSPSQKIKSRKYHGNEMVNAPESPHKPLNCRDGGHETYAAADEAEERLNLRIELLVFGGGHLGAVFILALLAEQGQGERLEAGIEPAELLEALVAYCVEGLEALGGGDFGLEEEGFGMGGLSCLDVERRLGIGRDLRKLRG